MTQVNAQLQVPLLMKIHLFLSLILSTAWVSAQTHKHTGARPDGHAPIMVMADHSHGKGDFMASYRFMFMDMDGMRSGTNGVDPSDVFSSNYTVSPTDMTMKMHMLGMMYAPTDTITLMGMTSLQEKEMSHTIFPMAAPLIALNDGSREFTTRSSGLGDLKLSALIQTLKGEDDRAHITLGLSLPTGSISKKDKIPGPGGRIDRQLPAPMQLGSGTTDLLAGFTYTKQEETRSWGTQLNSVIRLDENSHDYRLGNRVEALGWLAWRIIPSASVSMSAYAITEGKLHGTQKNVGQAPPFAPTRRTVTTAFGENYGGEQAGIRLGLNFLGEEAGSNGHRIAAEIDIPIYRDLNGFQLETDYTFTLGWQKAF